MAIAPEAGAPAPSLFAVLRGLPAEFGAAVSDRLELLSLELQRAGAIVLRMLVLAVVVAVLGVTAWIALWAIVVGALMAAGWHWTLALALVTAGNVAVVAGIVWHMRRLVPRLLLPATRRHLKALGGRDAASAADGATAPARAGDIAHGANGAAAAPGASPQAAAAASRQRERQQREAA